MTALIIAAIVLLLLLLNLIGLVIVAGLIILVGARLRQQIDSYGATVGDLVDYVERQEKG